MPKKRIPTDIRSIAREHTKVAMDALKEIAANPKAPESARVSASSALLDRGYGKPAQIQVHQGDEEGGPVRVMQVTRKVIDAPGQDRQSDD